MRAKSSASLRDLGLFREARERVGLPAGIRHECWSVAMLEGSSLLQAATDGDLVLWLVGTHHGRGRPWYEPVPDPQPPFAEIVYKGRVADSDVDCLIHGETGTGKELVARAIHTRSRRAQKPFVPVDCGAIPENLLESEFFGHEKGSFTGADRKSIGLLEFADGGTFFLDELGELPLLLQAKLLRSDIDPEEGTDSAVNGEGKAKD